MPPASSLGAILKKGDDGGTIQVSADDNDSCPLLGIPNFQVILLIDYVNLCPLPFDGKKPLDSVNLPQASVHKGGHVPLELFKIIVGYVFNGK